MNPLEQLATRLSIPKGTYEGDIPLLPTHQRLLPLTKASFHSLPPSKQLPLTFLDGGNLSLLSSAAFTAQFLRLYSCTWNKPKQRKKLDFYSLTSTNTKDAALHLTTDFFGADFAPKTFDSFDQHLRTGTTRVELSTITNLIRRLTELCWIKESLIADSILVYDGSLLATTPHEQPYLDALFAHAAEIKTTVVALAKTSTLITATGQSVVTALHHIAPEGAWYYSPLSPESTMYFAKLHENSDYIFRIEVYGNHDVLGALRYYSQDPAFLGYPYGLIDADRHARVSFEEASFLKTKLLTYLRKKIVRLDWYLNGLNAHEKLDQQQH